MKICLANLKNVALASLCVLLLNQAALADSVWHCSRSHVQIADASDNFTLAALTLHREVIRISLRDLHSAYQGTPVRMSGGAPLSACVTEQASGSTSELLHSIGAKHTFIKNIARNFSPVSSQIIFVKNEESMISCISRHHPAIGYLSQETNTEDIGPCF